MVYLKENGEYGFSWQKQYDYLLAEHPEQLEEIVDARLEVLALEIPELAAYYKGLRKSLAEKIDFASDNDEDFGYIQSDKVTKAFVKEKNLMFMFEDVPHLSTRIDDPCESWLREDEEGDTRPTVDWI